LRIPPPPHRHFCPNAITSSEEKLNKVQKSFKIIGMYRLGDALGRIVMEKKRSSDVRRVITRSGKLVWTKELRRGEIFEVVQRRKPL